jgi:hypothetical protein
MINATLNRFSKIYSIEIKKELAEQAARRFRRYGDRIEILFGDSARLLPRLLQADLPDRVIFWLDGHYSKGKTGRGDVDTPILAEIEAIAASRKDRRDVILIDDARHFGRLKDYPTREAMIALIERRLGRAAIVADDAFVVLPRY